MPLCISCRGEYSAPSKRTGGIWEKITNFFQGPLPQEDQESEAQTLITTPSPYICTRCGENNEQWHKWASANGIVHFSRFFLGFWGLQTILSIALPILATQLVDFTPIASVRIALPLALLLIFGNIALLYSLKYSLWRYDLLTKASRSFKPSLVLLSVIAFVLALVFGLIIVFMLEAYRANPEARPTEGLVRVITTILLAVTFVNVTLSTMFMTARDYANWLNREMPQPIYAQERRLLRVIKNGLREEIRQAMGEDDLREKVRQAIMDEDDLREKIQQAINEDKLQEQVRQTIDEVQDEIQQAVNEDKWQEKIQQTVDGLREKMRQIIGEDGLQEKIQQIIKENDLREKIRQVASKDREVETTIADMERTANAGVVLLINAETDVDQVSGKEAFKQIQSWRVTADQWGRIQKMHMEGSSRYIPIERPSADSANNANNGKKTDETKPEPTPENELIPLGEYRTQNDTTISITSTRRHSMR